jgi:hypothetical protein
MFQLKVIALTIMQLNFLFIDLHKAIRIIRGKVAGGNLGLFLRLPVELAG